MFFTFIWAFFVASVIVVGNVVNLARGSEQGQELEETQIFESSNPNMTLDYGDVDIDDVQLYDDIVKTFGEIIWETFYILNKIKNNYVVYAFIISKNINQDIDWRLPNSIYPHLGHISHLRW